MPELPEVETTRRGLWPHLKGQSIQDIIIRQPKLRYPVPVEINQLISQPILSLHRRAKYLIFSFPENTHLLLHLGMSGSLRTYSPGEEYKRHDHVIFLLSSQQEIRYHDPRRFGLILPYHGNPETHRLLAKLGPEPLKREFNADSLYQICRHRKTTIKQLIMNSHVVVGVGNIYASEALFHAGIRPQTRSNRISKNRIEKLVDSIKNVLKEAIDVGGTTLQDFHNPDGNPGCFQQELYVYGRAGEPCRHCQTPIRQETIGQRSTYWCPKCQH